MPGSMYFGIDGVHAPNFNKWEPGKNRGTVVYNNDFDLSDSDAQQVRYIRYIPYLPSHLLHDPNPPQSGSCSPLARRPLTRGFPARRAPPSSPPRAAPVG